MAFYNPRLPLAGVSVYTKDGGDWNELPFVIDFHEALVEKGLSGYFLDYVLSGNTLAVGYAYENFESDIRYVVDVYTYSSNGWDQSSTYETASQINSIAFSGNQLIIEQQDGISEGNAEIMALNVLSLEDGKWVVKQTLTTYESDRAVSSIIKSNNDLIAFAPGIWNVNLLQVFQIRSDNSYSWDKRYVLRNVFRVTDRGSISRNFDIGERSIVLTSADSLNDSGQVVLLEVPEMEEPNQLRLLSHDEESILWGTETFTWNALDGVYRYFLEVHTKTLDGRKVRLRKTRTHRDGIKEYSVKISGIPQNGQDVLVKLCTIAKKRGKRTCHVSQKMKAGGSMPDEMSFATAFKEFMDQPDAAKFKRLVNLFPVLTKENRIEMVQNLNSSLKSKWIEPAAAKLRNNPTQANYDAAKGYIQFLLDRGGQAEYFKLIDSIMAQADDTLRLLSPNAKALVMGTQKFTWNPGEGVYRYFLEVHTKTLDGRKVRLRKTRTHRDGIKVYGTKVKNIPQNGQDVLVKLCTIAKKRGKRTCHVSQKMKAGGSMPDEMSFATAFKQFMDQPDAAKFKRLVNLFPVLSKENRIEMVQNLNSSLKSKWIEPAAAKLRNNPTQANYDTVKGYIQFLLDREGQAEYLKLLDSIMEKSDDNSITAVQQAIKAFLKPFNYNPSAYEKVLKAIDQAPPGAQKDLKSQLDDGLIFIVNEMYFTQLRVEVTDEYYLAAKAVIGLITDDMKKGNMIEGLQEEFGRAPYELKKMVDEYLNDFKYNKIRHDKIVNTIKRSPKSIKDEYLAYLDNGLKSMIEGVYFAKLKTGYDAGYYLGAEAIINLISDLSMKVQMLMNLYEYR